ncbi:normal mucosa of esophagus-specific gene 1 protein isoform X3 [Petromyzon marinus]|uniref:normal mucosa of esophagus-specific gene 1 protein isoform X3 n=1 Tax=Petromyzon marinus TaxID=7757 RepID=UPI003F701962
MPQSERQLRHQRSATRAMGPVTKFLLKRKEVIPIVVFLGFTVGGGVLMGIYSLLTKSDVVVNKRGNPTPWENIDPSQPQKLYTITQQWEPVEALELVKKATR